MPERKINPRLNILGKYKTMNIIDPFIYAPAFIANAIVAPINFNPSDQEFDIVKAYNDFQNGDKRAIYSISPLFESTILPTTSGTSYSYSENNGGYSTIISGTITWSAGSSKRHVIVMVTYSSTTISLPLGSVWAYLGNKVTKVESVNYNTSLKFIHCADIYSITGTPIFYNCSGLSGVLTIPPNVTTLVDYCFSGCTGLVGNLVVPNSVEYIGSNSFNGCTGFTGTLGLSSSLRTIGGRAFYRCLFNGALVFPNTVSIIAANAFESCTNFTGNLVIPNLVTSLGDEVFKNCNGLNGSLTLSSTLTSIGVSTFWGCMFTGILNIPSAITHIDIYAFYVGGSFSTINCHNVTPPTGLDSHTFNNTNKTTCTLHVPAGSLSAYRAASYWSDFVTIIEDL